MGLAFYIAVVATTWHRLTRGCFVLDLPSRLPIPVARLVVSRAFYRANRNKLTLDAVQVGFASVCFQRLPVTILSVMKLASGAPIKFADLTGEEFKSM